MKAKQEAERKARELKAKQEAEKKAKELKAKQEAEKKAKELKTKQEAERRARELKARQEAEKKARELKAKQEAEKKAKECLKRVTEGGDNHTTLFGQLDQMVTAAGTSGFPLGTNDPLMVKAKALRDRHQKNRSTFESDEYAFEDFIEPIFKAALDEFEVDVHESAETAEGGVDAKSDISDVGSGAGKAKRIAGDSYKVLKSLLVDAKEPPTTEDGDTLEDLIGTTVVRVSHPTKGSIHWVAKTHLLELERKGFKFTDAVDAGPAGPGGDVESPSQCCVIV